MNKNEKLRIPVTGSSIAISLVFCLLSLGILIVSNGNLVAAIVPMFVPPIIVAVFMLPLQKTVYPFLAFTMVLGDMTAHQGQWVGPFTFLGKFFFENLNKFTGVGALKVNIIQIAFFTFLGVLILRTIFHNNIDGHLDAPASRSMKIGALVSLVAVGFSTIWGILRGGDTSFIPFQMKNLLLIPLLTVVFMRTFKEEKFYPVLARTLIIVCVLRIVEGAWFYFAYLRPTGSEYEYVMTHEDSFLFSPAIIVLLLSVLNIQSKRSKMNLWLFGGIITWGIIINDRRVCFVAIALCLVIVFFYLNKNVKRKIQRGLIYGLPLILVYVSVGMKSKSTVFTPVHIFLSINDDTDSSNISRKIENTNTTFTIKRHPILGTGFGFPYDELIPPVPLKFIGWQYMAHNHLLWLAYLMGGIGMFLLFVPMLICIFLAFRVYKAALNTTQRITSLMAICMIIVYVTLSFGDMGSIAYKGVVLISLGMGMVANLAKRLKVI